MSVQSVTQKAGIPADIASASAARVPTQTLGQNDFVQLLVTKMQSQDPMNPQGDTEFISQMAQFSALENSKSMQSTISTLNANGMIGRSVTIKGDTTIDGQMPDVTGVVTSVSMQNGSPLIEVNGDDYSLDRVMEISNSGLPFTTNTLTAPATTPNPIRAAA